MTDPHTPPPLCPTGLPGLDEILDGGLPAGRLYLVDGRSGTGKTTLGMQFLLEGRRRGDRVLYVTLSETREEIRQIAVSHGWDLDGVGILELSTAEESVVPEEDYAMFHPSEMELGETVRTVMERVEAEDAARVVIDSLSELRLLAQGALRYRRQIAALRRFFAARNATVLLLDDHVAQVPDQHLKSVAHGVLHLEELAPAYGGERRRLRVEKLRGHEYGGGYHDFVIRRGGLRVFSRLVAAAHRNGERWGSHSSGVENLDVLLGGGLRGGTSALFQGPAGSGKSTTAALFAADAARRGASAALFLFDETRKTLLDRSDGLGTGLRGLVEGGRIHVQQVDPAELSPGEFAWAVRNQVEEGGARVVVIDTLTGYLGAFPEERFLQIHLHELLTYLSQMGVLTILVVAQHGLLGTELSGSVDSSYLSDAVVLFRYFEIRGEVRPAVSMIKKRYGPHERTIRELRMCAGGVEVGEPLRDLHGVLSGIPVPDGNRERP